MGALLTARRSWSWWLFRASIVLLLLVLWGGIDWQPLRWIGVSLIVASVLLDLVAWARERRSRPSS